MLNCRVNNTISYVSYLCFFFRYLTLKTLIIAKKKKKYKYTKITSTDLMLLKTNMPSPRVVNPFYRQ